MEIRNGAVFFTHFIETTETINPGMLIHGWNRGAAFQTKKMTEGIDFIIPVMLKSDTKPVVGGLFGGWTVPEQNEGSRILTYVVIDAKNWKSMSDTKLKAMAAKCQPNKGNFSFHTPMNPFISLVQCIGHEAPERTGVKIFPSLFEKPTDKHIQLKVGVVGLSPATYTCLQNRQSTVPLLPLLKRLRHSVENPLESFIPEQKGPLRQVSQDSMIGQIDPARQINMRKRKRNSGGGSPGTPNVAPSGVPAGAPDGSAPDGDPAPAGALGEVGNEEAGA